MENTIDNKAKFFNLYYGQDVLTVGNAICDNTEEYWIEKSLQHTQYLVLKSLSSITDEDAIKLAELLGWELNDAEQKKEAAYNFINGGEESVSIDGFIQVVDFLRSKSYYLGNGLEIEYGWIKLLEDVQ